ncbi:MAG TPA: ester cyclase [Dehalococcoidia bacterium]|nr:ester cyclase [Dehalococcoidia bacterium]
MEENKTIVRRMLEAMDRGEFEIFDEVLSPDLVVHFPGARLDREQTEEMSRSFYAAFPDLNHTVEDLLAVDDKVVLRATDRGTHRGDFQGISATGREVEFGVIAIYRIVDGRIVEIWEEGDLLGLMQQLGAEVRTP